MKLPSQNISRRDILPGLLLLGFIALYVACVWYVRHLEDTVRTNAETLALESTRETSMRQLSSFLGELAGEEERLSSFFVAPENAVSVIEQIEGLGSIASANVSISGVQIVDKDDATGEGTMVMNIASDGSWNDMMRLAALLDAFPFVSRVTNLTLSQVTSGEGGALWSLRATMQLFLRQ